MWKKGGIICFLIQNQPLTDDLNVQQHSATTMDDGTFSTATTTTSASSTFLGIVTSSQYIPVDM